MRFFKLIDFNHFYDWAICAALWWSGSTGACFENIYPKVSPVLFFMFVWLMCFLCIYMFVSTCTNSLSLRKHCSPTRMIAVSVCYTAVEGSRNGHSLSSNSSFLGASCVHHSFTRLICLGWKKRGYLKGHLFCLQESNLWNTCLEKLSVCRSRVKWVK